MENKTIVKFNEYIKREFYSQKMEWISDGITDYLKANMDSIDYNEDDDNLIDDMLNNAEVKTTQKVMETLQGVYSSINDLMLGDCTIKDVKHEVGKLAILLIIVLNEANHDFLEGYSINELIECNNYQAIKKILDYFIINRELKTNILISVK